MKISCQQYGHKGILIKWPPEMSTQILHEMSQYCKVVQKKIPNIVEVRHAYHEVYIRFEKKLSHFESSKNTLLDLYAGLRFNQQGESTLWYIPVYYDGTFANDLSDYLQVKNLSLQKLIELHTAPIYTVHFIGFLPGFLYLGGLHPSLSLARKSTPSPLIQKGTLAIGGDQTGIYPQDSPGGWHGIGYTPVTFFDAKKQNPVWAKPGDKIKFHAVSKSEIDEIKDKIEANIYELKSENYHG